MELIDGCVKPSDATAKFDLLPVAPQSWKGIKTQSGSFLQFKNVSVVSVATGSNCLFFAARSYTMSLGTRSRLK